MAAPLRRLLDGFDDPSPLDESPLGPPPPWDSWEAFREELLLTALAWLERWEAGERGETVDRLREASEELFTVNARCGEPWELSP